MVAGLAHKCRTERYAESPSSQIAGRCGHPEFFRVLGPNLSSAQSNMKAFTGINRPSRSMPQWWSTPDLTLHRMHDPTQACTSERATAPTRDTGICILTVGHVACPPPVAL